MRNGESPINCAMLPKMREGFSLSSGRAKWGGVRIFIKGFSGRSEKVLPFLLLLFALGAAWMPL